MLGQTQLRLENLLTFCIFSIIFFGLSFSLVNAYQFTPPLELGNRGLAVSALQIILKDQGYYSYPEITGYYGPVTQAAVQQFQATHSIVAKGTPDTTGFGRVGPQTIIVLNSVQTPASISTPDTVGTTTLIPLFTRDLQWGMEGEDVRQLQIFLNAHGFFVADSGPGSLDNETTSFLTKTQYALIRFQKAQGVVPAEGYLGADTKAKVTTVILIKALQQGSTNFSILMPGATTADNRIVSLSNNTTTTDNTTDASDTSNGSSGGGGGSGGGGSSNSDTTVPAVSMTAPSDNATVSGATVTVSASASDDTGVSGVQFKLDGTNLSSEDTSSPYSITWDSTTATDTSYTLTAVARDASGNYATSSSIAVTVDNGTSTATTTLTQYGITWTFDTTYEYGQFVNGDYWVVGPVTVTSVSPGWNGTTSGSMIDPVPLADQGFDSRAGYTYSAGNRTAFPTTINATSSLISTIGLGSCVSGGGAECLDTAAVLTVVNDTIPANSFRPPYVAGSKPLWNTSDVDYSLLPGLPTPDPDLPDLTGVMVKPWIDFGPKVSGSTIRPQSNMFSYPRDSSYEASLLAAYVLTDEADVNDISNRLIQYGIDAYDISLNNDNGWEALGGFGSGRKWPILFSGIMLDSSDMKNVASTTNAPYANNEKFGEDGHTFFGQATGGYPSGKPLWGQDCVSDGIFDPWFANHDCRDSNGLIEPINMTNGGSYKICCTSNTWVGDALAAHRLGATTTWNHPAFFDYVDRWTNDPTMWTASTTEFQQDAHGFGGDGDGFMKAMWTTYRDLIPPVLSVANATVTSATTADLNVDTDTATGTLYWVVTTSLTTPSAAQIKLGQDNLDASAVSSGTQAVSATGTVSASATGLTGSTVYYSHYMHEDLAINQSNTVTSASFTTESPDVTAPVLSSAVASTTGFSTSDLSVVTDEPNGILYWVVTDNSTTPSATQIKAGQDHVSSNAIDSGSNGIVSIGTTTASSTALIASTTYYAHFMHEDSSTNQSNTLTYSSFTTDVYIISAINFDGVSDSISAGPGTLSFGSSQEGTFSMWLYSNEGAWPVGGDIFELATAAGDSRFRVKYVSSDRLLFLFIDATESVIWSYVTPDSTFSSSTWYHIIVSWDIDTSSFQAYLDDVDLSPSVTVNALTADWTNTTRMVGSGAGNDQSYADVYLNTEEQVDLSTPANRAKFIDGLGKPVDLGADGSVPTGSQPEVFLSGDVSDWHTNKGTAGGFTETGALTTASSSPSD